MDIITTSKLALASEEISSFYAKGQDYFYVATEAGISLEQIADLLCKEKAIFLYKKDDVIFIVFARMLKNSIALHYVDHDNFLSILKLAIVQQKIKKLYAFNIDSEVFNNLAIPVQYIAHEDFLKAANRLRPLHPTQSQLLKVVIVTVIFAALIIAQSFAFDFLKETSRSDYNAEKQKIAAQVLEIAKDDKKYKTMISELPTGIASSYKDIGDELSGVQK